MITFKFSIINIIIIIIIITTTTTTTKLLLLPLIPRTMLGDWLLIPWEKLEG